MKIPPSPPPFEKVLTFLKKNLFLFANAVLALLLFGFLLYSFDFTSLYSELIRSNTVLLLLAALCYLLTHFISALRYKLLLPSHSVFSFFSSHMKAMLASDATPGRVGYSLFILDLRKKGVRGGKGAKVMGVSFASDFLVRGIIALAAIWFFSKGFWEIGLLVVMASLLLLALLFFKIRVLAKLFSKIPFYGKRLENAYHFVFQQKTSFNQLLVSIGFSIAGAIARGLEWVLVLNAMGLNAGIGEMTVLSALLTALSFVPLSISGFGLQEGGGIVLLSSLLGFGAIQAAGAMILIRFVDVLSDLIVGGWFFLRKTKR